MEVSQNKNWELLISYDAP